MASPPEPMMRPSIGQMLDQRLELDARALAQLSDRLAQLSNTLATQAVDLADFQSALAHLQRRIGRHP